MTADLTMAIAFSTAVNNYGGRFIFYNNIKLLLKLFGLMSRRKMLITRVSFFVFKKKKNSFFQLFFYTYLYYKIYD